MDPSDLVQTQPESLCVKQNLKDHQQSKLKKYHDYTYKTVPLQGGHKPGKHGKPGKLREFEKLSKSQGKLREV